MIILDTSIWIEFFKVNPSCFETIQKLIEEQQVLAVDCIFGELLQGARNKREREIIKDYWENLPKAGVSGLWIEAGIYSSENKLISKGIGLIDAVIIKASQRNNALLWSLDTKLNSILPEESKFSN